MNLKPNVECISPAYQLQYLTSLRTVKKSFKCCHIYLHKTFTIWCHSFNNDCVMPPICRPPVSGTCMFIFVILADEQQKRTNKYLNCNCNAFIKHEIRCRIIVRHLTVNYTGNLCEFMSQLLSHEDIFVNEIFNKTWSNGEFLSVETCDMVRDKKRQKWEQGNKGGFLMTFKGKPGTE